MDGQRKLVYSTTSCCLCSSHLQQMIDTILHHPLSISPRPLPLLLLLLSLGLFTIAMVACSPSPSLISFINSPELNTVSFSDYGYPATARILLINFNDGRNGNPSHLPTLRYYLAFVNFTLGAFTLSIVIDGYTGSSPSQALKVVWTANRLSSFVDEGASLKFVNGVLVLKDSRNRVVWARPNPDESDTRATSLSLGPDGCLCLNNGTGSNVWSSCNEAPSDVLLPSQSLHPNESLSSHSPLFNVSGMKGVYSLNMNTSGVSLSINPDDGQKPQPYWIWGAFGNDSSSIALTCNGSPMAMAFDWSTDQDQRLQLALYTDGRSFNDTRAANYSSLCKDPSSRALNSSANQLWVLPQIPKDADSEKIYNSSNDVLPAALLRLDPDGNLRGYAFYNSSWHSIWEAVTDACLLPGNCRPYELCKDKGACHGCPVADEGKALKEHDLVCAHTFISTCHSSRNVNTLSWEMLSVTGVDYFAVRYLDKINMASTEHCRNTCYLDCSCSAAFFSGNTCVLVDGIQGSLRSIEDNNNAITIAFLKVYVNDLENNSGSSMMRVAFAVLVVLGSAILGGIITFFINVNQNKEKKGNDRRVVVTVTENEEDMLPLAEEFNIIGSLPTRFSYKELEAATKGFSVRLGGGGFGSVYWGVLLDGRAIAVKKLEGALQGMREFYAEMATLGGIHHWHLVELYGFCAYKEHYLLVYEYVPNGSLDKWLFSSAQNCQLSWAHRYKIAVGVAKALAYLHNGCRERIIHLDIKPQNVLLGEEFEAKVGDFGLSRFLHRSQAQYATTMKGTPGYIAPEWLLDSNISDKNDVYSYGMVLLELVSGRRNHDPLGSKSMTLIVDNDSSCSKDFSYFPAQALRSLKEGKVAELVDNRLGSSFDIIEASKLIRIALLCVQEDASNRPQMERVVQMLEVENEIPSPPYSQNLHYFLEAHLRTRSGNTPPSNTRSFGSPSFTQPSFPGEDGEIHEINLQGKGSLAR